jgi:hypothetical protein
MTGASASSSVIRPWNECIIPSMSRIVVVLVALSALLVGLIAGYAIRGDGDDPPAQESTDIGGDAAACQAAVAYYEAVYASLEDRTDRERFWDDFVVPAANQMSDVCLVE